MRVVLDTNILFSALLSPQGSSGAIYKAWRASKFQLITSTIQLEELRRASRYPKFKAILKPAQIGTLINNLQNAIVLDKLPVNSNIKIDDPNDAFLVSMTIAGEADYLVTGDHRAGLLQKKNINQTRIVTPTIFCKRYLL